MSQRPPIERLSSSTSVWIKGPSQSNSRSMGCSSEQLQNNSPGRGWRGTLSIPVFTLTTTFIPFRCKRLLEIIEPLIFAIHGARSFLLLPSVLFLSASFLIFLSQCRRQIAWRRSRLNNWRFLLCFINRIRATTVRVHSRLIRVADMDVNVVDLTRARQGRGRLLKVAHNYTRIVRCLKDFILNYRKQKWILNRMGGRTGTHPWVAERCTMDCPPLKSLMAWTEQCYIDFTYFMTRSTPTRPSLRTRAGLKAPLKINNPFIRTLIQAWIFPASYGMAANCIMFKLGAGGWILSKTREIEQCGEATWCEFVNSWERLATGHAGAGPT